MAAQGRGIRSFWAVFLWLSLSPPVWAAKSKLVPPFELQWGATPDAVANVLSRLLKPLGDVGAPPPSPAAPSGTQVLDGDTGTATDPPLVSPANVPAPVGDTSGAAPPVMDGGVPSLHAGVTGLYMIEQHYEGDIFAAHADRITPIFFLSQLFGILANFPSAPETPSSLLWERLVDQVSREYGPPKVRSKPISLLSWNAILQVMPPEANKSALLRIYNEADRNPQVGLYILQDLQVQTGLWVPEAVWPFKDGGVIKVVMQASGRNDFGLMSVRPLLMILKHDMFR